jgi:glycosyltransferase involved in cell wall biosynthesis
MFDLTIITINKNNRSGLMRTQMSVKSIFSNKEYPEFRLEWIVVDGDSTDGSVGIIDCDLVSQIIMDSNGVYSAMNKGIDYANGEQLFFLNSGDVVSENLPLVSKYPKNKILFFDSYYINRFNKKKKAKQRRSCYGMPSSHQGIVFPNSDIKYNVFYMICADYDYYLQHKCEKEYISSVTSLCEKFGLSFSQPILIMKEMFMIRKKYCSTSTAFFFLVTDCFKVMIKSLFNIITLK